MREKKTYCNPTKINFCSNNIFIEIQNLDFVLGWWSARTEERAEAKSFPEATALAPKDRGQKSGIEQISRRFQGWIMRLRWRARWD